MTRCGASRGQGKPCPYEKDNPRQDEKQITRRPPRRLVQGLVEFQKCPPEGGLYKNRA